MARRAWSTWSCGSNPALPSGRAPGWWASWMGPARSWR